MSAKEHKASILFKVIFQYNKKFSRRLRIHYIFQTIDKNYGAKMTFKVPLETR